MFSYNLGKIIELYTTVFQWNSMMKYCLDNLGLNPYIAGKNIMCVNSVKLRSIMTSASQRGQGKQLVVLLLIVGLTHKHVCN